MSKGVLKSVVVGATVLRALMPLVIIAGIVPIAKAGNPWWNAAWRFRFRITVSAGSYARFDKPAETKVNFTQLLSSLGYSGALDENSLRVVETTDQGAVVNAAVPFQFDKDADFNASTKASGNLVLVMPGSMGASASRYFDMYFEVTGKSFTPPSVQNRLILNENDFDQGYTSYKLQGPGVTYYYQPQCGGFSSLLDQEGRDWIDYNPNGGAGGAYRGIANAVYPEGYFHPGHANTSSSIVSRGPIKITVRTTTNDGKWECTWEFYPRYATMTMVKADHPYWFLYEGTPAGMMDSDLNFLVRSTGVRAPLWNFWTADLEPNEWVYFGDTRVQRTLFLAHHENDSAIDSYWTLEDATTKEKMTVFGFGRSNSPTEGRLVGTPQHLTFGFIGDTTFSRCADSIFSAYKPLTVTAGQAELGAPPAPTLVSPANNGVNVAVPCTFIWNTVDGATTYRLQVSTSSSFTSGIVVDDSTIADTIRTVSTLASRTAYYWRVRGKGSTGSGDYSPARQFTTNIAVPQRLLPINGAVNQTLPLVLQWRRVPGATSYRAQVGSDSTFAGGIVVNATGIVDTFFLGDGLQTRNTYYWRVASDDASGNSGFSTPWRFSTSSPAPSLLSPSNGAGGEALTLTLRWKSASGASAYHVQVSPDSTFAANIIVDEPALTDTSRVIGGLQQQTRYFWRVAGVFGDGPGPYSIVWSFATAFPSPTLLRPNNGATSQPLQITFSWSRIPGASRYHFQLAKDSAFSVLVKNDTTVTDTLRPVFGLENSTRYYWRVRAEVNSMFSAFSPVWTFRSLGLLPDVVVLLSPTNLSTINADSARCVWRQTTPPAARFWVEIAVDSLFTWREIDSTVTDTSTMLGRLFDGFTYWLRVRGGTNDEWGPFSEVRNFTVRLTGVASSEELPREYSLSQNYPNPFNPSTMIEFALPRESRVRIEIYSALGEKVGTLVDEILPAGTYSRQFDAQTRASGMYVYRMIVNGKIITRRMLLLR